MVARILVVEDDPTSLALLCYLLDKAGYQVLMGHDGQEGLEVARRARPHLIAMDVQMPIMDGYQVARELKRDITFRGVPIVAVTAVAMVGDKERILASGFDAYITKPIIPEDFVAQIEAHLPPEHRASRAAAAGATRATRSAEPAAPSRSPGSKGVRILLVDDRADNLRLMEMILESSGYEVAKAPTAGDALAAARITRPDLIVSDVHMAGTSGYGLLELLRRDPIMCDIPVVLISSSMPFGVSGKRLASLSVSDFIVRPIDPDELLARIAAVLPEPNEA